MQERDARRSRICEWLSGRALLRCAVASQYSAELSSIVPTRRIMSEVDTNHAFTVESQSTRRARSTAAARLRRRLWLPVVRCIRLLQLRLSL